MQIIKKILRIYVDPSVFDEEVREYFRKGAERVWNERIRYRQKMKLEGGEKT